MSVFYYVFRYNCISLIPYIFYFSYQIKRLTQFVQLFVKKCFVIKQLIIPGKNLQLVQLFIKFLK